MVQESLVSYISTQLKAGVTEKAIKGALTSAGWASTDVDDTFKKVSGSSDAAQPASVVKPTSPVAGSAMSKPADAQMIRVSDLISAPDSSGSAAPGGLAKAAAAAQKVFSRPEGKQAFFDVAAKKSPAMAAVSADGGSRPGKLWMIIGGVVVLALLGLSGYLYFQNNSLSTKVASLGTVSTSVSSQIASLNSQVSSLNASNAALTASSAIISTENTELMLELSFYAVPQGNATTAPAGPVALTGILTGGTKYMITTQYGAKISIANAKDPKVAALLVSSVGTTTRISGTYIPGSQAITALTVNGSSTQN